MGDVKKVHLVLSAGGAQTWSYVGAIQELLAQGISFKSISCCSSGSIVGALLAAKADFNDLEKLLLQKGLHPYVGKRRGLLSTILHLARFPFDAYIKSDIKALLDELVPPGLKMSDLELDYVTIGIDVYRNRFIVFSKETFPDMLVSEALEIATAIAGLYKPYQPASHRLIVDAGAATWSPIWLTARHDDNLPIVVLRSQELEAPRHKANIFRYLFKVSTAVASSWDWYQLQNEPRVRLFEINSGSIGMEYRNLTVEKLDFLFEQGRKAVRGNIDSISRPHALPRQAASRKTMEGADKGEKTAEDWSRQFLAIKKLQRNQIFISYHPKDEEWLNQLQRFLYPSQRRFGLKVWSEKSVALGEEVQEVIATALESTRLAILLVSIHFLGNDIFEKEVKYLIDQAQKGNIQLLWVLLSECPHEQAPELSAIQPAFPVSTPLSDLNASEKDAAWKAIVDVIQNKLVE